MSGPMTSAAKNRMEALRDEGLPASWIAEDLGCSTKTVQLRTRTRPEEVAAWRTDFQHTRKNPELFALHCEFAPARRGRA